MNTSPSAVNAPRIIVILLGLMLSVHLGRLLMGPHGDDVLLRYFAFIPIRYSILLSGIDLSGSGGWTAGVWTFVTYMFFHSDWTHLIFNGLWLLAFGSAVAWRIGTVPFLIFSTCCGVAGALLHLFFHWGETSMVIGASAAISGHMAAAIRFVFRAAGPFGALGQPGGAQRRVPLATITETFQERRSLAFLSVWLFINMGMGVGALALDGSVSIAWEAHIGGFAVGLFFFGVFDQNLPARRAF